MPRPRSKNKRFHLLHVRVSETLHDELQRLVVSRPSCKISDIMREAITLFILSAEKGDQAITFSHEICEALSAMAPDLNRPPVGVAEDCVVAIMDSLQCNRSPLIVEELRLRRQYKSRNAKGTPLQMSS